MNTLGVRYYYPGYCEADNDHAQSEDANQGHFLERRNLDACDDGDRYRNDWS